jgi:hypothetical protein
MAGCFDALTLREIGRIRSRLIHGKVQVDEVREQTEKDNDGHRGEDFGKS